MINTFWYKVRHRNDDIKHKGFDYRNGQLLRKTLSNVLYLDAKRTVLLDAYSNVLEYIVDYIKMIKKTYNWTLDKYYRDFN